MRQLARAGALLAALLAVPLHAADGEKAVWLTAPRAVRITALRDPVDKSYRRMMDGMALFEALHALAPQASLRYRLLPRKPDAQMKGVAVSVVGDSFERAVPVAGDGTFTLARDARALEERASVRSNRKAGTLTWRAEVRTPGLPEAVLRLGDLRLECRVGMEAGLVSHYPSLFERVLDRLLGAAQFCEQNEPPYLFFAERPLFGVTLVAGGRRQTLSVRELYAGMVRERLPEQELRHCDCEALLDRAYFLPLGDASWPDETRVELDYMNAPPARTDYAAIAGWTKADVARAFGGARSLRFDSGFEIWAYPFGMAVLFDPSGSVARARLRGTTS